MQRSSVTCPTCAATVGVILDIPGPDAARRTATVLKRCPGCAKWGWMKLALADAT